MRHFGLTSPPAIGGNRPAGSHIGANTTRSNLVRLSDHQDDRSNSGRGLATAPLLFPAGSTLELDQPGSEVFEPSAVLLFILVMIGPALCVGAAVLAYLLFVA